MAKAALGKGYSALINTRVASPKPAVENGEWLQVVPLQRIIASPLQPRTVFRDEHLDELVLSIKEHGIIQPLIARKRGDLFELIAGERRWRAAQRAGLTEATLIVREASDQEILELALIENLQREDLNPIEEAKAFARLAQEFHLRQEDIALKVGKSRASIANSIRLLDLHEQLQSWLTQDLLSVGHAKVLLSIKSPNEQLLAAEKIIRAHLTVRAAEKLVADHFLQAGLTKPTRSSPSPHSHSLPPSFQQVQNRLQAHLATHVVLHNGPKRGRIEIEYYGDDDLQRLLSLLGLGEDPER